MTFPTHGVRPAESDLRGPTQGIRPAESDPRKQTHGSKPTELDLWNPTHRSGPMESEQPHPIHGIRCSASRPEVSCRGITLAGLHSCNRSHEPDPWTLRVAKHDPWDPAPGIRHTDVSGPQSESWNLTKGFRPMGSDPWNPTHVMRPIALYPWDLI